MRIQCLVFAIAVPLLTNAARAGMVSDHGDVHGQVAYYPGATSDWNNPNFVALLSQQGNPAMLPVTSWMISNATITASAQAGYSDTLSLTEADAHFNLSVNGTSTLTAYADFFSNDVFSINRDAPLGVPDINSYQQSASYKIDGYASPGDTVRLFLILWCDAQPVYPDPPGEFLLSPTGSARNEAEFTIPFATIDGIGAFHYSSSAVGGLFNLGNDLGTGINTQYWVTGENFVHIGALIEHNAASGNSWVNFDPITSTPISVPEPCALVLLTIGAIGVAFAGGRQLSVRARASINLFK